MGIVILIAIRRKDMHQLFVTTQAAEIKAIFWT